MTNYSFNLSRCWNDYSLWLLLYNSKAKLVEFKIILKNEKISKKFLITSFGCYRPKIRFFAPNEIVWSNCLEKSVQLSTKKEKGGSTCYHWCPFCWWYSLDSFKLRNDVRERNCVTGASCDKAFAMLQTTKRSHWEMRVETASKLLAAVYAGDTPMFTAKFVALSLKPDFHFLALDIAEAIKKEVKQQLFYIWRKE